MYGGDSKTNDGTVTDLRLFYHRYQYYFVNRTMPCRLHTRAMFQLYPFRFRVFRDTSSKYNC